MSSLLDRICVFCTDAHHPIDCPVYPTFNERQTRLNELKRCYRCLKTGHIPPKCRNAIYCAVCGKNNHHTATCCRISRIRGTHTSSKNEKCIFCTKHYESSACRCIQTYAKRMQFLHENDLCIRCLKQHSGEPCEMEPKPCDYCKSSEHHNAFCSKSPFLKENTERDPAIFTCLFCGEHPKAVNCKTVLNLQDRKEILAKQGRCESCLRFHATENCFHRFKCKICKSTTHHAVICPQDMNLRSGVSSVSNSPTTSDSNVLCGSLSSSTSTTSWDIPRSPTESSSGSSGLSCLSSSPQFSAPSCSGTSSSSPTPSHISLKPSEASSLSPRSCESFSQDFDNGELSYNPRVDYNTFDISVAPQPSPAEMIKLWGKLSPVEKLWRPSPSDI